MKTTYLCLSRESGSFYVTIRRGKHLNYRSYNVDTMTCASKKRLDKVMRGLTFHVELDVARDKVFTYHYHNPRQNTELA